MNERTLRDFTVAVFVAHEGRILLHWHKKLQRWLPPGGHIEPNELPDEAAIREVMEETNVHATLLPRTREENAFPGEPRLLCRPAGIQLEAIDPGHEHIDLIYFATGEPGEPMESVGWYSPEEWSVLALGSEVERWCRGALDAAATSP